MTCKELQEEELEVLFSIYDGDESFRQLSPFCFQYKIGRDDDPKSFLLEITWVEEYPNVPPKINLDAFYNNKIIAEVKKIIVSSLLNEAELQIGTPMTYTLIEWAKNNAEELTKLQPEKIVSSECNVSSILEEKIFNEMITLTKKEKKPKLSKQQKRKLADKLDSKGEHPRGWDWVDIIKHLSQVPQKQINLTS